MSEPSELSQWPCNDDSFINIVSGMRCHGDGDVAAAVVCMYVSGLQKLVAETSAVAMAIDGVVDDAVRATLNSSSLSCANGHERQMSSSACGPQQLVPPTSEIVLLIAALVAEWYGTVLDLRSRGRGFESRLWLLCTNDNSACHPSRVG